MQIDFVDQLIACLPHTRDFHYAMLEGGIFTKEGEPCVTEGEGLDQTVMITTVEGDIRVRTVVARTVAFKQCRVPPAYWNKLEVGFVDGNSDNQFPGNMVLIFPIGGIEHDDYPGFFYIPFHTRFVINATGQVWDTQKKTEVKVNDYGTYPSTKSMAGYRFFASVNDIGKKSSLNIHRALVLAFKSFPANVDKLDVNHRDGIKANNELDNLEWRTRRDNNLHATELGMRPDNHAVVIKSIFTGEERVYFSLWECARALNCHGELVRWRCLSEGQSAFTPGILMKKVSCTKPWLEVTHNPDLLMNEGKWRRSFTCTDTHTGEKTVFNGAKELAAFLKIGSWKITPIKDQPDGMLLPANPNDPKDHLRYHVRIDSLRFACESLFAEKQKSYLS